MKTLRNLIASGALGIALASSPSIAQPASELDKYAPLREALTNKMQEAILEAEEARLLAEEYEAFLKDPDTDVEEKPDLRRTLLREQRRSRKLREQAVEMQTAIEDLKWVPDEETLHLAALQDAYQGLGDLGDEGQAAWEALLQSRDATVDVLEEAYAQRLAEATTAYEELNTASRASKLLLNAIDPHRGEANSEEFRMSLKLPRIKTAVEFGFGLNNERKDDSFDAQATLLALVAYSQFFWDHYRGVRGELAEGEFPSDATRNIFGVASGGILASDSVVTNRSSHYYLSEKARAAFNGRIHAIWGEDDRIAVTRWDQNSSRSFHRACTSLSTSAGDALLPNPHAFELLDQIDELIAEKERAATIIAAVHSEFRQEIANAKDIGDQAALSSAHFNAQLWAGKSLQAIAAFEAARALLDQQLEQSAAEDWTPDAHGIAASAQTLRRTHKRFHSVRQVKHELTALLE